VHLASQMAWDEVAANCCISVILDEMDGSLQLFLRLRIVPFSEFSLAAFAVGMDRLNSTSLTVRLALTVRPGNGPVTLPSLPRSGNINTPLEVNLVWDISPAAEPELLQAGYEQFVRECTEAYVGRQMTGLRLSEL